MKTLEQIIEDASRLSEQAFNEVGGIRAHWFVITRDGRQAIIPPFDGLNKNTAAIVVRYMLQAADAVKVVFVDESWSVVTKTTAERDALVEWYKTHDDIENYPGREELVAMHGEDEHGRLVNGHRAIIRSGGKPKLGPLKIDYPARSEGRLTGWLPGRGTKQ